MNIWIINHYATKMYFDNAGRHHYFANILNESYGYSATIIAASTNHPSGKQAFEIGENILYQSKSNINYIFLKTREYSSGKQRALNMLDFYRKLMRSYKSIVEKNGRPDIILASSVHPLTLVAGIKIAKKLKIPCVCEVRDLWPLSIVEYSKLTDKNLIIKALYKLEKWCYKKADALIFSMEGGKKYIQDKGCDNVVNLDKVHYINNGICLDIFDKNKELYNYQDEDLDDDNLFKVVYTGSISKVNGVDKIIKVAEALKNNSKIKFFIFGNGSEREALEKFIAENNLKNIKFYGLIDKIMISSILSKSDLNIINIEPKYNLYKYGVSMNKLFEYLASGKPILSTFQVGFSIIDKYKAGITTTDSSVESIKNAIIKMYNIINTNEYDNYCQNAYEAAKDFDFELHAKKLNKILLEVKQDYESRATR